MMVQLEFASSFYRHTKARSWLVEAKTVRDALEVAFAAQPLLRSYVLDDQGRVRQHITFSIFMNDKTIADRESQQDLLDSNDRIFVFQALSGG